MEVHGKLIDIDLQLVDGKIPKESDILPLPEALKTDKGEQAIHESLCRHSEYFPLPYTMHHPHWFRWVLTKYALPSGNITDFVYLTTTSVSNTIVLVEIEDPSKKIWVGTPDKPKKSEEFVRALEQVERWRTDLSDPAQQLHLFSEMRAMMGESGLSKNLFNVEYALIYGRSSENISAAQKAAFSKLRTTSGIHLLTYDNLVEAKNNNPDAELKNFVKVARPGPKFSYAYLNREPTSEFAYLSPGTLLLEPEIERLFMAKGYDIGSWKKGHLLVANNKLTSEDGLKKIEKYFAESVTRRADS